MWIYSIKSGKLYLDSLDNYKGIGYSGYGTLYHNDPLKASEKALGPIPPGKWHIGPAYKHASLGPLTMNLDPYPETEVFGRSAFRIHGDNSTPDPYDGSRGCIILNRLLRTDIAASESKELLVINQESEYVNETPTGLQ